MWDDRNPNLTEQREPSVIVRACRFEGLTAEVDRIAVEWEQE